MNLNGEWIAVLISVTSAGFLALSASTVAQPTGSPPNGETRSPPPEAIKACQGQAERAPCQIQTPPGLVSGTCATLQGQLLCMPKGALPESPEGVPPDRSEGTRPHLK